MVIGHLPSYYYPFCYTTSVFNLVKFEILRKPDTLNVCKSSFEKIAIQKNTSQILESTNNLTHVFINSFFLCVLCCTVDKIG
jgi:hypothetical protein